MLLDFNGSSRQHITVITVYVQCLTDMFMPTIQRLTEGVTYSRTFPKIQAQLMNEFLTRYRFKITATLSFVILAREARICTLYRRILAYSHVGDNI